MKVQTKQREVNELVKKISNLKKDLIRNKENIRNGDSQRSSEAVMKELDLQRQILREETNKKNKKK